MGPNQQQSAVVLPDDSLEKHPETERKLKILYVSHSLPPKEQPLKSVGGMQNVSMQLMEALKRRQDIETYTIIQRAPWKGIGIATTLFLFRLLWEIPKAVEKHKPDVILFSSMVTSGVIPFLTNRINVPMVTINHGKDVTLPLRIYQNFLLPRVFKKLDGVISVSNATRDACIERGMSPEKGVALPNGLDDNKLNGDLAKKEARKMLSEKFNINLKNSDYLLLTVGRLVKRKGHSWFVKEVLPRLDHNVNYLVIGDGPEFDNIHLAAEDSGVGLSTFLLGRQPEEILEIAYAASDLFVMPNIPVEGDMEGFGIVLLEANQVGLPAVAADLEGIQDVIAQGVNGFRVPHSRPDLFAQKVNQVLEKDLEELSEKSREYVIKQFSWDSVVDQYLNFLQKIVLH